MTEITGDHKQEWRKAREQADAAIARLNDLYAATGRTYRVRLDTFHIWSPAELDGEQAAAPDDPNDLDDLDELPSDGYGPGWAKGRGNERAEAEDDEI
jgi:hypothetical protein